VGIELMATNASKVAAALLAERRKAGSPAMGMVLTLVVVADEGDHYDALKAARQVSREHPSRILGVIRKSARGAANLDAEVRIGDGGAGETVLLRMSGELTKHPESVVLPLLLPDSPVVVWWPAKAPDDPAADPLGALAKRRITDTAAVERGRTAAMLTQAVNYAPGNTDLSWTRLTPWRALLAAALDQYPAKVSSGVVTAERVNPSAELLVAWLCDRLKVEVTRAVSKGPGITSVSLMTGGGPIEIARPDGLLAEFSIPNAPNRPVALKRREIAELLAEELRRLDPDDVYATTVKSMCMLAGLDTRRSAGAEKTTPKKVASKSSSKKTDPRKITAERAGSKKAASGEAQSKEAASTTATSTRAIR
jgi:glucose-6-phosphate dehydrogenase assembly protein OpcA